MNHAKCIMPFFLAAQVLSSSLTLVSPQGGENFSAGQQIAIRWSNSSGADTVDLSYSPDNGLTWHSFVISVDTSYLWTVPYTRNGCASAKIRVYMFRTPLYAESDGFTIQPSIPDAYEPNGDIASAHLISLGDSVVKDAIVLDPNLGPSSTEGDWFKVALTAGKLFTVTPFGYDNSNNLPSILLLNSDGKNVGGSDGTSCVIEQSGYYYLLCQTLGIDGNKYGLSLHQSDGRLSLVSPNGGERFSNGQKVTIRLNKDPYIKFVSLYFSADKGMSWNSIAPFIIDSASFLWTVPYLLQTTDQALIKVTAEEVANPLSDISDGNFTIDPAAPDAYEPNNSFATAYPIRIGDSVVKHAIIANFDSSRTDPAKFDDDYFKINLTKDKLLTITVSVDSSSDSSGRLVPVLGLGYASNQEFLGGTKLYWVVPQSGDYYCRVWLMDCGWCKYNLLLQQSDPGSVEVVSPNGGEIFSAGQTVPLRWTKDGQLSSYVLSYSIDNGTTWVACGNSDSLSYRWKVPFLTQRTDRALIKVTDRLFGNMVSDVSDAAFTVQACPPDAYEPNNDFSTAYPLGIGDSVVKNAVVIGSRESYTDTTGTDFDFFRIAFAEEKIVTISCLLSLSSSDTLYPAFPTIELFDSSRINRLFNTSMGSRECPVKPGVYYCKISSFPRQWYKYSLSIHTAAWLRMQKSVVDTASMQTTVDGYTVRIIADSTRVNMDLTLKKKVQGTVSTTALSTETTVLLPADVKMKVRSVAIVADSSVTLMFKTADITIPYSPLALNGYSENLLNMFWFDGSARQWVPLASRIDTVKHQITASTSQFGVFGVFVMANAALRSGNASAPFFGLQANYISGKRSIAVRLTLPNAAAAELRLYDIQGRCVIRSSHAVEAGGSLLRWNFGALANGKYFLSVKAGAYSLKKTLMIMR